MSFPGVSSVSRKWSNPSNFVGFATCSYRATKNENNVSKNEKTVDVFRS